MRIFLCSLLIWCYTYLNAQQSEPFKKANTIVIETGSKSDSIYVAWGRHLAQNGYSIDKSDKDFLTLTTGAKDFAIYYDFILISSIDSKGAIKIKSKWRAKEYTEYYDWDYLPGKATARNLIHEKMLVLIESFASYSIKYSKE
jgi:hypothetical protein